MAPTLGKRKRVSRDELFKNESSRSPSPSSEEQSDNEDLQSIFQKAFEAKFKPLDVSPKKKKVEVVVEEEEDESEAESDWSGISEDDGVEVVEYTEKGNERDLVSKSELKAFMVRKSYIILHTGNTNTTIQSSKPPTKLSSATTTTTSKPSPTSDDETDTAHLKNDLALQQLLRDSHLLSKSSTPSIFLTGSQRHKSTDLHLVSLGAKKSIMKQESMPMSHRKGINSKAKQREEKRRLEAKENGIVLEREVRAKRFVKTRERGVGGPSVGKFRGGTLSLSKKDVAEITGSGGRGKGKGKGGKGRK